MLSFFDQYIDKILPEPNSGCWFWMGGLSERGYGVIYPEKGRNVRAHRISYTMTKGKIPDGLVLDHLCRIHCCVNPDHLEAVTQRENVRRGLHGPLSLEQKRAYRKAWRQSPAGRAAKHRQYIARCKRRELEENL